ncbi:rim15, signal transduction response regulator [Cryptotrichosporon argae]
MALANVGSSMDWWAGDRTFWTSDTEDDAEPLLLVSRPARPAPMSMVDSAPARPAPMSMVDSAPGAPGPSALMPPPPPPTHRRLQHQQGRSVSAPASLAITPLFATTSLGASSSPSTQVSTPISEADAEARERQIQAHAVGELRTLAEHAKTVNIVMELSLQGEEILYVNDAIIEVLGCEPEDVLDKPIASLVTAADTIHFTEATQRLLQDPNSTVKQRFKFEVQQLRAASDESTPTPTLIEVEGVGMLIREDEEPSHTMWVMNPVAGQVDTISDALFPHDGIISDEGVLCRICEREIVTWFFEKHNETCDAVHRLEAEIVAANENIQDLHQIVVKLSAEIDAAAPNQPIQYQGVLFQTLSDPLADVGPPTAHLVAARKDAHERLQDVVNILAYAKQIETPSVQDDEADMPFDLQHYLSPAAEDKLAQVMRWRKPLTTDRALALLYSQVEEPLRRKQKAVARMMSTIRYSEKTRHEWEDKVNELLAERQEASASSSDSGSEGPPEPTSSPTDPPSTPVPPETSPPGHRKIAPLARLPITQGHPQRPSTRDGRDGSSISANQTIGPSTMTSTAAVPTSTANTPAVPSTPTMRVFPPLLLPAHAHVPRAESMPAAMPPFPQRKSSSPLLVPIEKFGHHRRVSSSKSPRDGGPLSPRIPSAALQARASAPSIKDFHIVKPISRGAFGAVYLAKKVATGDYYAIKALKKADMIAKNQITNVKAERNILINQASSPHVAKLFFSFQSKEYLYLVMEYLNGGDCSTLVKTLGGLPEEWAKTYTAEVVLGLEYLHARNIVHRDIKPDNLLIDSRGHLKLTDFGLSKIGLLNRQQIGGASGAPPAYLRSTSMRNFGRRRFSQRTPSISSADSPILSPEYLPPPPSSNLAQSYFPQIPDINSADESSGSESPGIFPRHLRHMPSVSQMWSAEGITPSAETPSTETPGLTPPGVETDQAPRFVGTPDYLAPESITGTGTDDRAVDWWALGVVLYEFIYGIPPFHAETPEKVFDNVVSRRIDWHEDEMDVSPEARDLMDRLMCSDPTQRLGARGAEEVKQHPFFATIDWKTVMTSEASFVPEVTDPESTDYFDARGALHMLHDDDAVPAFKHGANPRDYTPPSEHAIVDDQDDFGTFNFKNLPVLKQANDDVIRKMRTESMAGLSQSLEAAPVLRTRPRSLSTKLRARQRPRPADLQGPPSPSTSTSSTASTPSRASIAPGTPGSLPLISHHFRRTSELKALDRLRPAAMVLDDDDALRRSSAPSRMRAGSGSSASVVSDRSEWRQRRRESLHMNLSGDLDLASSLGLCNSSNSPLAMTSPLATKETESSLDVLIAEDNPISQKILETLLTRMGCRCTCVEDGATAVAAAVGNQKFDLIICDLMMPAVNGEQVARMIRSTANNNANTPIIAATSYEQYSPPPAEHQPLFSAILAKPVVRADLERCLENLGFVLAAGAASSTNAYVEATTDTPEPLDAPRPLPGPLERPDRPERTRPRGHAPTLPPLDTGRSPKDTTASPTVPTHPAVPDPQPIEPARPLPPRAATTPALTVETKLGLMMSPSPPRA